MEMSQVTLEIHTSPKTFLDITSLIQDCIKNSDIQNGVCHLFIKHTSASLVIQKMGIINHYELLSKGLISTTDIVYFVSISILFIMLCQLNIEKK